MSEIEWFTKPASTVEAEMRIRKLEHENHQLKARLAMVEHNPMIFYKPEDNPESFYVYDPNIVRMMKVAETRTFDQPDRSRLTMRVRGGTSPSDFYQSVYMPYPAMNGMTMMQFADLMSHTMERTVIDVVNFVGKNRSEFGVKK